MSRQKDCEMKCSISWSEILILFGYDCLHTYHYYIDVANQRLTMKQGRSKMNTNLPCTKYLIELIMQIDAF